MERAQRAGSGTQCHTLDPPVTVVLVVDTARARGESGCVARAKRGSAWLAPITTRRLRHTRKQPGVSPPPAVSGGGGCGARAALGRTWLAAIAIRRMLHTGEGAARREATAGRGRRGRSRHTSDRADGCDRDAEDAAHTGAPAGRGLWGRPASARCAQPITVPISGGGRWAGSRDNNVDRVRNHAAT